MKQKIKKVFENAVWWSGVVMFGLILGLSLQFVKAWTEPTEAPPGGNLGAPINTGIIAQAKQGVLQVLGFTLYNNPDLNGDGIVDNDVTGKVLTAQNAYGAAAWAAGGTGGGMGGCYVLYENKGQTANCLSGFTKKGSAGDWGYCADGDSIGMFGYFRPPGGNCSYGGSHAYANLGEAYWCCQ